MGNEAGKQIDLQYRYKVPIERLNSQCSNRWQNCDNAERRHWRCKQYNEEVTTGLSGREMD